MLETYSGGFKPSWWVSRASFLGPKLGYDLWCPRPVLGNFSYFQDPICAHEENLELQSWSTFREPWCWVRSSRSFLPEGEISFSTIHILGQCIQVGLRSTLEVNDLPQHVQDSKVNRQLSILGVSINLLVRLLHVCSSPQAHIPVISCPFYTSCTYAVQLVFITLPTILYLLQQC